MLGAIASGIVGLGGSLLGGLFGGKKKLKLPPAPQISPLAVSQGAMDVWSKMLPGAQQLAEAVNRFNLAETLKRSVEFGLGPTRRLQTEHTESLLRGEIPADLRQSLSRQASAAALAAGGGPGSFSWSYSPLSLGLTSMQLRQQGMTQAAQLWNQFAGIYRPLDYTAAFLPGWAQVSGVQQWNAQMQYQRAGQQAMANAAYVAPWQQALGGFFGGIGQVGQYQLGRDLRNVLGSPEFGSDLIYSLATLLGR